MPAERYPAGDPPGTGSPIKLTADTSALQSAPVVATGRLYGRAGSTLTSFAP
jgi:hypothetical protein